MRTLLYILNGKIAVPEPDVMKWAEWYHNANRVVKGNILPGNIQVSTVFLGTYTNIFGDPLLFETMIFGGEHNMYICRYSTWEEAEAGHDRAIEMIFE